MSVITEKSPKHCAIKQATIFHKLNNKLFIFSSTLILIILSLILLVWYFILHPKPPHFSLQQPHIINHLNATAPPSIQITLLSANPNKNVGIYYDGFLLYASCNGRIVTDQTAVRPFYQHHRQTDVLNASLVGNQALHGKLELDLKVEGWLRWKVGNWVSGRRGFKVNCAAVASYGHVIPASGQGAACSASI